MENDVAKTLEYAAKMAPYGIEKERYMLAVEEILRLQRQVDELSQYGEMKVYEGTPWYARESDDSISIFRDNYQIMKIPKRYTPYEEYWPEADMLSWIINVLNDAEKTVS